MSKHRIPVLIILTFLLTLSAFSSWPQDSLPKHAPQVLPGVEPEMLTPEYWIDIQEDADKIVMTPLEIERFNEKVRNKQVTPVDYYGKPDPLMDLNDMITKLGLVMNPILPLELPDTEQGSILRERLISNIDFLFSPMDLWGSKEFYDGRNAIYNDEMKQKLVDAMNIDAVPDVNTRRFGIIVNHANLRYYPTEVPGYHNTVSELDRFQGGALLIGMPVAILHQSVDGEFLFVETPVSRGWVLACDIAISDREAIKKLTDDENFLMATGDKVPVYGDPQYTNFARNLFFSAAMPLIKYDNTGYVVKMPYRKPDGVLGVTNGYIKHDADVHIGYLPYTKRNVIIQMFKLLDTPYGWEDQNDKRDCCGTMWVLLRCFGITTGRFPQFILKASDHQVYIDPGLSTEKKIEEVSKIEPVITMAGSSGHIVLYLGKARNGKLYFIHQAGWGYKDENGEQLIVNRVSVNEATHSWYHINQAKVFTTFKL
ncbi:MAG: SH3 domain-containing protein [Candidatus Latescibacteria bacterium]|nr:SH3 domain-containing protein [Candidatus Latescibacterota bacterium]